MVARLACALVLATCAAPVVKVVTADGGRITVAADPIVTGGTVRLRDVAALDGPAALAVADVELATAPSAGESRLLDGKRLLDTLVVAGLDLSTVTYNVPPTVRVRRATQEIPPSTVRQLVEDDLRRRFGDDAGALVLRTVELTAPIRIPTGTWSAQVVVPPGTALLGRVRLQLDVAVDGHPARTAWITADIGRFSDVVVATREIERGALVPAEAVGLDRQDLSALPRDVATDVASVVGRTARVPIVAFSPVRLQQVATGATVRRGDVVELVAERGALRLSALGEVKQDAGAGERVAVMNRTSGKVITGRVVDGKTVTVEF